MRLRFSLGWNTSGFSIRDTEEDDWGVKKEDTSRQVEEVKWEIAPVKTKVDHAPKAGSSLEEKEGTIGLVRRLGHDRYLSPRRMRRIQIQKKVIKKCQTINIYLLLRTNFTHLNL